MNQSQSSDYYRKQAKLLVKLHKGKDRSILDRLRLLRRFRDLSPSQAFEGELRLHEAQYVIALEHGFES